MDRNVDPDKDSLTDDVVALRKESVDRNILVLGRGLSLTIVALRKESVDRNLMYHKIIRRCSMSLSARRAWIEIRIISSSVIT